MTRTAASSRLRTLAGRGQLKAADRIAPGAQAGPGRRGAGQVGRDHGRVGDLVPQGAELLDPGVDPAVVLGGVADLGDQTARCTFDFTGVADPGPGQVVMADEALQSQA